MTVSDSEQHASHRTALPQATHRLLFRLIDGETTEQLVHARSVTHNVYPQQEACFNAEDRLRKDVHRKLCEGQGVFDYTLTQPYGGMHMIPVRHVLWVKVISLDAPAE